MTLTLKQLSFAFLATASANVFSADAPATEQEAAQAKQAKQAIEVRQAAFTLIGNSFRPIGDASQGKIEYNQADIQRRANRIWVITDFLDHSFPEASNLGDPDTKAKADVWSKKTEFDNELKKLKDDVANLVKVSATEKTATDAFKTAASAVAKDCKSCHEGFKAK